MQAIQLSYKINSNHMPHVYQIQIQSNIFKYHLLQSHNTPTMQIEPQSSTNLPSFTLYPITTIDMKTCYESQFYKLICTLNGPYYDRRLNDRLQTKFNITLTNCSGGKLPISNEKLTKLEHQLQQLLNQTVIISKYERMVFDITLEIIECNPKNPHSFLLSPLINLLIYTAVLKGVELYSIVTCMGVILKDQKIQWEADQQESNVKHEFKEMLMAIDSRDRRAALLQFQGDYSYVHYEKMSNALIDANTQILSFVLQKINQVYLIFNTE